MSSIRTMFALLTLACWMAACGGGDPSAVPPEVGAGAATIAGDDTSVSDSRKTALASASEPQAAWALCAGEGSPCSFSGTRSVRYGAGAAVVEKLVTNGVWCGNDAFGDPAVGVIKSCWLAPANPVVGTGDAATWTPCASEQGSCDFSGLREVRYGTATQYVTREMSGPVRCNNETFGDPAVGVAKTCSYAAAAAWMDCATEDGQCAFTGTRTVRYGTPAKSVTAQFTGGVMCSNSVFGDPIVGVAKRCWYSATPADAVSDCDALPPLPSLPASYKLVTSFCKNGRCARPDDDIDDTDAIEEALANAAGSFLVFPPGKYLISRSLRVKLKGITLWGPGATIHATNWDDQSIIVEADNTSIYSFRLTAVTGQRGSRAEHTRIAIYGPAGVNPVVKNTVIRDNQIVNAGEPGSALANSATGAGIFVNAADGFLIAGNTVVRTLADGIHLTGGARNGRVVGNTVRENGDDMIAMVSYAYADPRTNPAWSIAADFANSLQSYQVRNILVANNQLSGQYWGRGIAVVGGRDITVRGNTLKNIPYGAAVLLARETQSGTYGLTNIVVEKNTISEVQTLKPAYDVGQKFANNSRTGHGAIEVHASMFLDEMGFPALIDGFSLSRLAIRNNVISASATPAVRVGVDAGGSWTFGLRAVTGAAPINQVAIDGNLMSNIANGTPVQVLAGGASCSADIIDGRVLLVPKCDASPPATPAATGASLSCPKL